MDVSDCKQTVDNPLRSLLLMNSLPETGHSRSSTNDPLKTVRAITIGDCSRPKETLAIF